MSNKFTNFASHAAMFAMGLAQGCIIHARMAVPDPSTAPGVVSTTQTGQLVCDEAEFDCGERIHGDRIEHAFVLRNTGSEPVFIESVRADAALECLVDLKTVPPGKHARLKARALIGGPEGMFRHQVTVTTNSALSPVLRLDFVGRSLSKLSVDPKPLLLGAFRASDPPVRTIQVRLRGDDDYQVTGVRSNSPILDVQLENGTAPGSYSILVQPRPEQHLGSFQGWAQLVADHRGSTMAFGAPVHGYSLADPQTLPPNRKICQLKRGAVFTVAGRTVDGKVVDLHSFGGEPVVLAYWASWDPVSTSILRELDELSGNAGRGKFRVVGHSVDSSPEPVREAIAANEFRCPILFNDPDETGIPVVLKRHKILALPLLLLVDADGRIQEISSSIEPIQQAIFSKS